MIDAPPAQTASRPWKTSGLAFFIVAAIAAILSTLFLLFWKLDWIGFTWDEYVDFQIVTSVAQDFRNIVGNDLDPTQGRLSHLVAYPLLKLMGASIFSFKLTYVLLSLISPVALYFVLRRTVSRTTAWVFALLFATTPYFLSSARTAATAGDSLTLLATILVIWSLGDWHARASGGGRTGGAAIRCGAACGLALGAKLTSALLLPMAMVWMGDVRGGRKSLGEFLKFVPAVVAVAFLAHPLFFRGPMHLYEAFKNARGFDNAPQFLYLGQWVAHTQWYFPAAVLLAKTSLPLFACFLAACAHHAWRACRREAMDPWVGISFIVLGLAYLLVLRHFQNGHYYLPALAPMMIITARSVDPFLADGRTSCRVWALPAFSVLLMFQSLTIWQFSPDFLQAGRQYGLAFQGQMAGPAVNHCQGGPLAIAEFNDLQRRRPYPAAYVLLHCGPILHQDEVSGPVKPSIPVSEFNYDRRPERPYRLLINRVYDYSENTPEAQAKRRAERDQLLEGCRLESKDLDTPYQIYACD